MNHPQPAYQPHNCYPPYPAADSRMPHGYSPYPAQMGHPSAPPYPAQSGHPSAPPYPAQSGQPYPMMPPQTDQPYRPYPNPQTTVFVYDEAHLNRSKEAESGMLAALCAACLCCWLLPMGHHH